MTNTENLSKDNPTNPQPDESSKELAEWTIMIYMAGDNNLADDCVNALKRLQTVNTGDVIHVIAQFDPSDTRVNSQRLVMNRLDKKIITTAVQEKPSPSKLANDRVKIEEGRIKFDRRARNQQEVDPGETDTADPKTLFDFISWSSETFKAKRYMLVLAGHSSGIEEGYLLRDEHPVRSMTLEGLIQVLQRVRDPNEGLGIKIDMLGMDSCLMSMIEICYELATLDLVDVYVSSQSMTPNPGWPYGEIVEALMESKGKAETDEFARRIVNTYVNSYVENAVNSGLSTDLAAVRVAASNEVVKNISVLGHELGLKMKKGSGDEFNRALVHAHWEAQSYNGERFVDLRDFCDLAERYCQDAAVTQAVTNVRASLDKMVVASCFCGIDYQYSFGLSIYFPWSTIFAYYQNLPFVKETGAEWFRFLVDYVDKTRREPRGGDTPGGPSKRFLVFRRDPPYDHGPTLPAASMRNPPRKWSKLGISDCIKDKPQLEKVFDSMP